MSKPTQLWIDYMRRRVPELHRQGMDFKAAYAEANAELQSMLAAAIAENVSVEIQRLKDEKADLLAACKRALDEMDGRPRGPGAIQMLRAAIAKAEGGAE